jgi:hypothetical protein
MRTREAALAYTAIAIVMTWPVASRIAVDIAGDLGDPVLNCWIMNWTGGQVLAALSGNFNALHLYWHGNIFHPEPLTIAYSEHLTPQMLQILPILALTDNVVLGYNLLFLSTFLLSGLGMFLLVRDLTGRPAAAFVAGLAYAFAPYRLSQLSHLQVLSSQWMPFAIWGFWRCFQSYGHGGTEDTGGAEGTAPPEGRNLHHEENEANEVPAFPSLSSRGWLERSRARPLALGTAALAIQGLSCGYYLVFFPPFVAAWSLYEMARRKLLRNWRLWRALAAAAIAAAIVSWPFVSPYLELRRQGTLGERTYREVVLFSADTWAFGTAPIFSRVLGPFLRALPEGEGYGFPGLAIAALALVGVASGVRRGMARARTDLEPAGARRWRLALSALLALDLIALLVLFVGGRTRLVDPGGGALLIAAGVLIAALLWRSPAARRFARSRPESLVGVAAAGALATALLALGPEMSAGGEPIGAGPYLLFHELMPGADAIRVPARFFMLMALFLAILAGYGAAALLARRDRAGAAIVAAAAVVMLAESWMAPLRMSAPLAPVPGFHTSADRIDTAAALSPIYQRLRGASGRVVVIEFPYANLPYDMLATYYAGYHRKPLINGFSGFFPESYLWRANFLSGIPSDFEAATRALRATGATHAVVHEAAFVGDRGSRISNWLRSIGARPIVTRGDDLLFELKW